MTIAQLHRDHWLAFKSIPFKPQPAVGDAPLAWATRFGAETTFRTASGAALALTSQPVDRTQVRQLCLQTDVPVWAGYISAMAWGMQGAAGRLKQAQEPLKRRDAIVRLLETLRKGTLSRSDAYEAFRTAGVSYLGPSYFTKLLYFFDPSPQPRFYIMDQWTAKSVNLLAGREVVHLTSGTPTPMRNNGASYEAFCLVIDAIAKELKQTGEEVEQRLFSNGGKAKDLLPWRAYVKQHWSETTRATPYRPSDALQWAAGL